MSTDLSLITDLSQSQQGECIQSNGFFDDLDKLERYYKISVMLSESNIIPDSFRGNPASVFLALEMAKRLDLSLFLVMQSLYIVHGKPAWSGSFCSSLITASGLFRSFRYVEKDHQEEIPQLGRKNRSCYIEAVPSDTPDKVVTGSVIDLKMAVSEGWASKPGSKWKTMPEQMLRYRAATFFARTYCASAMMGTRTLDELEDIAASSSAVSADETSAKLKAEKLAKLASEVKK